MIVKPCPICGRKPKITNCILCKDGIRQRLIHCPNYCAVLNEKSIHGFSPSTFYTYIGNEDDNAVYKEWNNLLINKSVI